MIAFSTTYSSAQDEFRITIKPMPLIRHIHTVYFSAWFGHMLSLSVRLWPYPNKDHVELEGVHGAAIYRSMRVGDVHFSYAHFRR